MSVFTGGFGLDALEGVCAHDGVEPHEVLDLLDRLVAQSLVEPTLSEGLPRYRMLETIRQYGWERLVERGEEKRLLRLHRDFFLTLTQRLAQDWFGPRQADILTRLRTEHGNLLAALEARCLRDRGFRERPACPERLRARRPSGRPRTGGLASLSLGGRRIPGRGKTATRPGTRGGAGADPGPELAWLSAAGGEHQRAGRLLGVAYALERGVGTEVSAGDRRAADFRARCEAGILRALGRSGYEQALAEGGRVDGAAQAIDYALGTEAEAGSFPAPAAPAPLTRREQQVAALVASGMTNGKIAAELVLSPRTVDSHVDHILTKLDFSSRAQIEAWWTSHQDPMS
ncbi:LuxR C-terminal-related transcriptional regulator [Streptomyces sp. NPDC096311]|uniref:LuxR C-terminal-related transcriptional regulator n=1 Tax=Streptomyces sp. NPDC096311 TaxID=3366083 RepID=UPI003817B5F1